MIRGQIKSHSRHLYDIHKIRPHIEFYDDFRKLVLDVRKDRKITNIGKETMTCPSAEDGADVNNLLRRIIEEKIYQEDYIKVTGILLYERVSYEDTVMTLEDLIRNGVF
jgi:hypothetical protein